jgi:hypothetical protein
MQPSQLAPGVAYLGSRLEQLTNLTAELEHFGCALTHISDSAEFAGARPGNPSLLGRAQRLRTQLFGTRDRGFLDYALRQIDDHDIQCVVAYWGTRPLPDIRTLKRLRPRVKFVLNVLCHPLGLERLTVHMQNAILARASDSLDGIIASNSLMEQYLRRHMDLRGKPVLTLSPYWCARLGPTVELPPPLPTPNLLFLGRMDWKTGQRSDNVTGSLRELMRHGIDVHFSRSPESRIDDPHARPFDAMPMAAVANFAAPLDASLIVYNLDGVAVTDRFENTVPDRLITSLAVHLPVAIPAQGFAGCREYLQPYGAVLEYGSMADLAEQLRDRERVAALRRLARQRGAELNAEATFPQLRRFLHQVQPTLAAAGWGEAKAVSG